MESSLKTGERPDATKSREALVYGPLKVKSGVRPDAQGQHQGEPPTKKS